MRKKRKKEQVDNHDLCDKLRDTEKKQKKGLIFTKTSYLYCTIIKVFSRTQINNLENQPNNPVIPAPFSYNNNYGKKQKNNNKQRNKKSLHNFFYNIQH